MALGDALVAGGTLALAGVTFWLAWQTRRDVALSDENIRINRESIRINRDAIAAQDMPYVIPSSVDAGSDLAIKFGRSKFPWCGVVPTTSHTGLGFVARLWNLGKGPAIALDVQLMLEGYDCLDRVYDDRPIASGGVYDAFWELFEPPALDWETEEWAGAMRILYAHADGSYWETVCGVRLWHGQLMPGEFRRVPGEFVRMPQEVEETSEERFWRLHKAREEDEGI